MLDAPRELILAAALMLTVAGCVGKTKTTVIERTITERPATTPTTGSTPTSPSSGATTSDAPTRIVHRAAFQSPTANIGCSLIGGVARCDIVSHQWSPPPRPSSCPREVDFGQGLAVGRSGRAQVVCAGDTVRDPTSSKLAYGTGTQVGSFVCVSRTTGVTCTNRFTGHGFLINSQRYQLF